MHLLDGASIDRIAAVHSVHRATAARWLERIRERLASGTRRLLQERLRVSRDELASLVRLIDSQLDLSLSTLLSD
jgi:RNA polymerase sigma-70 factor (ECF subfamily)